MTVYFDENELLEVAKERKKVRNSLIILVISYLAIFAVLILSYLQVPYGDKKGVSVQVLTIIMTVFYIVLFALTFGIKYKITNKYYQMLKDLKDIEKTETVGIFKGYSEMLETRDGVDQKALEISVYSERRQEWFSRGVYIPYLSEFPNIEKNAKIKVYTVANNLYGYEILTDGE